VTAHYKTSFPRFLVTLLPARGRSTSKFVALYTTNFQNAAKPEEKGQRQKR